MKLKRMMSILSVALICALSRTSAQVVPVPPAQTTTEPAADQDQSDTFTNPLLRTGPDPWVVSWRGFYYYSNTSGNSLTLRKTADITDLRHAQRKAVWVPDPGQPWSKELWAPELHRWGDKWYIYFAADGGDNSTHRLYVVENESDDPIEGTWTFKGKITDKSDRWAIDPTTFELRGQHYLVWSGWNGDDGREQDLFIAHMSNPWTIDSKRTMISKAKYPWERHGRDAGQDAYVNEGPEFISHGDQMFIVFSASDCATDFYTLGVLQADIDADPLNKKSWKKIDHPFLSTDPAAQAFGPGHNGFFKSPDGQQDWIIYHANPAPGEGCENFRSPRIQRFNWDASGLPYFGSPVPLEQPLQKPSGKQQTPPQP